MKLSISNIAWETSYDNAVYELMKEHSYEGLEIAPTRIIPDTPYDDIEGIIEWKRSLDSRYGFEVPSMQSIWYGRNEKLFGSIEDRKALCGYTKKAIDFAAAIGCCNLVFGCPRNRYIPDGADEMIAIEFFRELGDYAMSRGTAIGMEANPPIYNTNYINDTISALRLIDRVDSPGFGLNLDIGTMIANDEDAKCLVGHVTLIKHVHVSEPGLKPVEKRKLHKEIFALLRDEGYTGYISIEMGKGCSLDEIGRKMEYVRSVFG